MAFFSLDLLKSKLMILLLLTNLQNAQILENYQLVIHMITYLHQDKFTHIRQKQFYTHIYTLTLKTTVMIGYFHFDFKLCNHQCYKLYLHFENHVCITQFIEVDHSIYFLCYVSGDTQSALHICGFRILGFNNQRQKLFGRKRKSNFQETKLEFAVESL